MEKDDREQAAHEMIGLADEMGKLLAAASTGKEVGDFMAIATGSLTMLLSKLYAGAMLAGMEMTPDVYAEKMRGEILLACGIAMMQATRLKATTDMLKNTGMN